jgi:hypothetical protein
MITAHLTLAPVVAEVTQCNSTLMCKRAGKAKQ